MTPVKRFAWGGGKGAGLWHVDDGPWSDDWRVRRTVCGLRFSLVGESLPLVGTVPWCWDCDMGERRDD